MDEKMTVEPPAMEGSLAAASEELARILAAWRQNAAWTVIMLIPILCYVLLNSAMQHPEAALAQAAIDGLDGAAVADALVRHGHPSVVYEPSLEAIPDLLRRTIRRGDVVLTLGAGDVFHGALALALAEGRP